MFYSNFYLGGIHQMFSPEEIEIEYIEHDAHEPAHTDYLHMVFDTVHATVIY